MDGKYKIGDLVRRKVDGKIMAIVGVGVLGRGGWKCAWMDGHLRHTDEFTECELEPHDPTTLDLESSSQLRGAAEKFLDAMGDKVNPKGATR